MWHAAAGVLTWRPGRVAVGALPPLLVVLLDEPLLLPPALPRFRTTGSAGSTVGGCVEVIGVVWPSAGTLTPGS